jgi:mono/diheme cytochrome c family protein
MKIGTWSLVVVSALIAAGAARAQTRIVPNAANGEQLATRWCASCHVVAPDQRAASADTPSFASIAAAPDFSEARLAFFLLDPHPKMPNMSLTRREAADLAAFIATRKK